MAISYDEMGYPHAIPQETEYLKELAWCPDCQSPPSSDFSHVAYCQNHMPQTPGALDRVVDSSEHIFATDAGGEANKRLCDFIHRERENMNG